MISAPKMHNDIFGIEGQLTTNDNVLLVTHSMEMSQLLLFKQITIPICGQKSEAPAKQQI